MQQNWMPSWKIRRDFSQQSQIMAIMAKFAGQPEETIKGKGKDKVDDDFY